MKPRRRVARYSLRTLLILVALFTVWIAHMCNSARQQRLAVAYLLERGGRVRYDSKDVQNGKRIPGATSNYPQWLVTWVGVDLFHNVHSVDLNGQTATDDDFAILRGLPRLKSLFAATGDVTDDGLAHLATLRDLTVLSIPSHRIEGSGLAHLSQLNALETLDLGAQSTTTLSDDDLSVLAHLKNLRDLNVGNNPTLSNGFVKHLKDHPNLEVLDLLNIPLTDACIPDLAKIITLRKLNLSYTQITDSGVEELRDELPNCAIRR